MKITMRPADAIAERDWAHEDDIDEAMETVNQPSDNIGWAVWLFRQQGIVFHGDLDANCFDYIRRLGPFGYDDE